MEYYCKYCFRLIITGDEHQEWCPKYKPPISLDDLFPGLNSK